MYGLKTHLKKRDGHLLKMRRVLQPGESPNTAFGDLSVHLTTDCSNCLTLANSLSNGTVNISFEGISSAGDTASGAVSITGTWTQIANRNAYGPPVAHFTGEYNGSAFKMIASIHCEGGSATGYSTIGIGIGDDGFSSNIALGASPAFSQFSRNSKEIAVALSGTSNYLQNITWSGTASIVVE